MTRKATPVNLLDELIPTTSETTAIRSGLKWDYSQAGDAADEVLQHAVEIKRSERRASEAIIEAGEHLLAVKGLLAHGQWLDWLGVEFGMSDRTAQRMMSVAEQFAGKSDTVSNLSTTVLYLLAADSTPEPARAAVLEQAASGETVTKAQAQAVIEEHKPRVYESGLPVLDIRMPAQGEISDPWAMAIAGPGSRQGRIELLASAIMPWLRQYRDEYGREWRDLMHGNVAHTNGTLWRHITEEARLRKVSIKDDFFKDAIKQAFSWLSAAEPVQDIRMPSQTRYIPEKRRAELLRTGYGVGYNPQPPYGDGLVVARYQGQPIGVYADGDAAWAANDEHARAQADKATSNGYASQSQIEGWLKSIGGTPAELRQAAETRTGRVYEALVLRAWSSDHYELSPITASAALRNAATDREYAAKKAGADAVQRSVDATAAYREATQVVLVQPARLREFQAAFEGAMSTLADWALECGHQAEASAAARAIRACIELIEKDLAE